MLIGAHALYESKFRLYDAVYSYIKPLWGDRVTICYIQTDSIILRLRQVEDLYSDLKKLEKIVEFSNAPKETGLYDNSREHVTGLLKFEAFYIRHFIALRSNVYSILEQLPKCNNHPANETCSQCIIHHKKGVKQKATHDMYISVLKKMTETLHEYKTMQQNQHGLLLNSTMRKMLCVSEGNRMWITPNESRPFGYQEV